MSVYIIAEVGTTQSASEITKAAKFAGADCIKYQVMIPELTAGSNEELEKILKSRYLNKTQLIYLRDVAKKEKIDFLCSAFEEENLNWLAEIDETRVKIPSCRNEDINFLAKAAQLFKEIVLSTGMMENDLTLPLLTLKQGTELKNIALLHCVSAYPCPFEQLNLSAMKSLFGLAGKVGLSDHTVGWEVPVAAAALGAQIIEKHFTLKRDGGVDDCVSLEPDEFADMVKRIRNVELAIGDGIKRIMPSEEKLLWRKR